LKEHYSKLKEEKDAAMVAKYGPNWEQLQREKAEAEKAQKVAARAEAREAKRKEKEALAAQVVGPPREAPPVAISRPASLAKAVRRGWS